MHIDLPLHGGKCPAWLFEKMTKLAEKFLILFVKEQGVDNLLEKLSHPLWFQSLGCYLGFDWHSSGLTTVVGGVLSQALKNINYEIGLYVAGGKGKTAISTPKQLESLAWKYNLMHYKKLQKISSLIAKTDNYLIQDGFNLYYHQIFYTKNGNYTIIQQGMNQNVARRYHRSRKYADLVIKTLKGKNLGLAQKDFQIISSKFNSKVLNLISQKSNLARNQLIELVSYIKKYYKMPDHHIISKFDFDFSRLIKTISLIKSDITSFYDLLNLGKIGAKSIFNLTQASELIYGTEADWSDPARFSFTHGGKDGTPYKPIPQEFDDSIYNLQILINKAKKEANLKKVYFYTKKNLNQKNKIIKQNSLFPGL